jgi:DNA topoisomerase-1
MALCELETADTKVRAKKNVARAIERVSARLGNTPAICRKCYIHPAIVTAYLDGSLRLDIQTDIENELRDAADTLRPEEAAVLSFLRARVARDVSADAAPAPGLPERRSRAQIKSVCNSQSRSQSPSRALAVQSGT